MDFYHCLAKNKYKRTNRHQLPQRKNTLGAKFKDDKNIWNAMNKLIKQLENELESNKEIGDKIWEVSI